VKRAVAVAALLAAVVVVVVLVATRGDDGGYKVRAIFDNAGFVIPGEDVKIAGVKVGTVADLEVTEDFKAAVVLDITEPGYQDFRRDASCIVRPQNLIGERFVECTPTQPRPAGAEAPPPLRELDNGQRLLPVENTMQTVDIDLIGNTMREPERERLSLILNELGTGLAGRGRDLNEVIRRANPALAETNKVLEILARQNEQLEQLAVNSDRVLAPLARDRTRVASAIRNSSEVARATAERRQALAEDIETLPRFLDEFEPTMEELGTLADETTPVLRELGENSTAINNVVRRLGPFSQAAIPAFDSLGEAAKTGTPAVIDARPVIADVRALSRSLRPVGATLRDVLVSFRDTGGIERLMDYIFYQVAAINGFDAVGHYLRAGIIVNQCVTYSIQPVPGCSAKFPQAASSSSGDQPETNAIDAVGDDPVLRRTAIALAEALGKEVDKAKREQAAATPTATPSPTATQAPPKNRGRERREPEIPEAIPTVDPNAPTPSPTPAPTQAAPAPTAAPPAATPTPDPGGALLDFLFGQDGTQ